MNKLIALLLITFSACAAKIGPTGPQGLQGATGSNGTDATPVTVVQLCPGVTPSYPDTFPEYAVCIKDNLYGVYSANGGFLAELPPGTYLSQGLNSICTVVVQAHCVVSQ